MTGPTYPDVTVIVVTWQGAELLPACLHALAAQEYPGRVQVWVVDNASTDGTAQLLARDFPRVRVLPAERNLGFAGGCAFALPQVGTPVAVLLNNDAQPRAGWLAALAGALDADPQVAAVASKVVFAGTSVLNSAGGVIFADGYGADRGFREADGPAWDTPATVMTVPGTAMALRTAAVAQVGGFDADLFLYYEDTDVCWRLRLAGWDLRYEPAAVVDHLHAASSGTASRVFLFHNERNRLLVLVKNATARRAAVAVARYAAGVTRAARRREWPVVRLRLAVLASFVRLLPRMLTRRRAVGRFAVIGRRYLEAGLIPVSRRRPDGGLLPETGGVPAA